MTHETGAALSVGRVLVGVLEVVALVLELLLERHDDVVVQALRSVGDALVSGLGYEIPPVLELSCHVTITDRHLCSLTF